MLLKGPAVREPDATEVPLSMPAAPGDAFETRELPLTAPEATAGADGVLGMRAGDTAPTPAMPAAPPEAPGVEAGAATPAGASVGESAGSTVAAEPETAPTAAVAPTVAPDGPPAPAAARVAAGVNVLTVGTYANAASASALAARLRAAGLPVLSERVRIASGAATRLRVGLFGSRSAAEAARQRVEQISGAPSRALVLDAPAARESAEAAPAASAPPVASTPANASTPPAASTPSAATRAAAAGSGFAVQLSAPSVEADANALRDRARAAGFASFVQRVDTATGARYRVRLGPVADRAQATAMLADAKSKLGLTGIVVTTP
jgi:DedD protein